MSAAKEGMGATFLTLGEGNSFCCDSSHSGLRLLGALTISPPQARSFCADVAVSEAQLLETKYARSKNKHKSPVHLIDWRCMYQASARANCALLCDRAGALPSQVITFYTARLSLDVKLQEPTAAAG